MTDLEFLFFVEYLLSFMVFWVPLVTWLYELRSLFNCSLSLALLLESVSCVFLEMFDYLLSSLSMYLPSILFSAFFFWIFWRYLLRTVVLLILGLYRLMLILDGAMTLSKLMASSLFWELWFAASEKDGISVSLTLDLTWEVDSAWFSNIILFLLISDSRPCWLLLKSFLEFLCLKRSLRSRFFYFIPLY